MLPASLVMLIVPAGVLVEPATQLIGLDSNGPPSGVVSVLESKEKPKASAGSIRVGDLD